MHRMGVMITKKLTLILTLLFIVGCSPKTSTKKAVYFFQKEAQLSIKDLQAHPEVAVVQTFDELKRYANQKLAHWIDKSATPLNPDEEEWINEAPQTFYPIVLVGTSDTLHAFKGLLRLCCFMGPAGDYPGDNVPGFSILQWKATNGPDHHAVILLQGYNQEPTVQAILDITNALLEGRLSSPTATP
jgi:hypothetical protein